MTTYLWASFGQFGPAADPVTGLRQLVARCKALGIDVRGSPYLWTDKERIVADVLSVETGAKIIIGGASLGDDETLEEANMLAGKRDIDLAFGFQRSRYGVQFNVPKNVILGVEIHDPQLLSDPFGDDPWIAAPGNTRSIIKNIPIVAPHPGDYGVGQDTVFFYIKKIMEGA